jgi:diguanylate cyclase (GGDEF)-like protein
LRKAAESQTGGTIAIVDLDHFKLFNDRFGHTVGDSLLQLVAQRLVAALPKKAFVSRFGGDEFAVFTPYTELQAARRLLERLLEQLSEPFHLPDGSSHAMTASIGMASFNGPSIDETLRATDVALYAAKARGRNQAVAFDDDTRQVLAARRELAAAVQELQERNRALRDEARTDALTGLRNRLALDEVLDLVVGGADSAWSRAAVAFIDIDHFGDYNHLHGDSAGDKALTQVASAIRHASRESDLVYRKGGEEIVVLLGDVDRASASSAGERLRTAVHALGIPHRGSATAAVMTVTVGVATGKPGCTIRDLMDGASAQAMAAKVDGSRNSVKVVHLDPATSSKAVKE